MNEKEIKKLIKTQIVPYIIGLRNETTEGHKLLKEILEEQKKKSELQYELEIDNQDLKGKDGYTPVADKDYPSKKTLMSFISDNLPKRGKDYFNTKDIKDIVSQVETLIPKPKNGKDGIIDYKMVKLLAKPLIDEKYNKLKKQIKDLVNSINKEIKEISRDKIKATEIRDLLENLKGFERLDAKSIKGLEKFINTVILQGGGAGSGLSNFLQLSDTPSTYSGQSLLAVRVKSDETGLEFYTPASSSALTYMFKKAVSDIVSPQFYQAVPLSEYTVGAIGDYAGGTVGVSTTPTIIGRFVTNLGFPNVTVIPAGPITLHCDTKKVAGSNNYYVYAEIYTRTLGGTETLIATSDNSTQSALNTQINQTVTAFLASNVNPLSTDRLEVIWYAVMVSSTATIHLYFDDATSARIEFPTTFVDPTNYVTIDTTQTIDGPKTFSTDVSVPDEAYGAGWNGSVEVPTKNALYDKIESVISSIPSAYTDEQAQDAVGGMVNSSLTYEDGTPSLAVNLANAFTWTAQHIFSVVSPILSTLAMGSVLFLSSTSAIAEDNKNFYWGASDYRLSVTSTLGAEKVTNGTFTGNANGWTLGTGWAYSSNTVVKNANGTGTLSQAASAIVGELYEVQFTISAWTVGTVSLTYGGVTPTETSAVGADGTYKVKIRATSTGSLIFTPTNTSRFTIDSVSVKRLSGGKIYTGNLELFGEYNDSTPSSANPFLSILNSSATSYIDFKFSGTQKGAISVNSTNVMGFWLNGGTFNFYTSLSAQTISCRINSSGVSASGGGAFGGSVSAGSQTFSPSATLASYGSFGRKTDYINSATTLGVTHSVVLADASASSSCSGTPSATCASWSNQADCEKWDAHGGCAWSAGTSCSIYDNESPSMATCAGQAGCTVVSASCSGAGDQTACEAQDDSYGGSCAWNEITANCSAFDDNYGSCTTTSGCTWSGGGVDCSAYDSTDQGTCEGNAGCIWNAGDNTCYGTCSGTYGTGTYQCDGTYNTGSCTGTFGANCYGTPTCAGIDDSTNCGNETGCSWITQMDIALPQITSSSFYREYVIIKYGATGTLRVTPYSGQTIDGSSSPYSYGTTAKKSRTFVAKLIQADCSTYNGNESTCGSTSGCTQNYTACTWDSGTMDCSGHASCDAGDATDQATCEAITYFTSCSGLYTTEANWWIASAHL